MSDLFEMIGTLVGMVLCVAIVGVVVLFLIQSAFFWTR